MIYQVLYAGSPHGLASQVNSAINAGWQVQGGVAVEVDGNLFQAMVKQKECSTDDANHSELAKLGV